MIEDLTTLPRSVDEYEKVNRIDEGTYGVVFRARDKATGYGIKCD